MANKHSTRAPRPEPIFTRQPAHAVPFKPPLALRQRFGDCCARLSDALKAEKEAGRAELARSIGGIRVGSTMESSLDVKRVCRRIESALAKAQLGAMIV